MVFDVDKLKEVLDNRQFDDDDDGDLEVVLDAARLVVAGQPLWWCEEHKQSGKKPNKHCVWAQAFGRYGNGKPSECRMVEWWGMPTGKDET